MYCEKTKELAAMVLGFASAEDLDLLLSKGDHVAMERDRLHAAVDNLLRDLVAKAAECERLREGRDEAIVAARGWLDQAARNMTAAIAARADVAARTAECERLRDHLRGVLSVSLLPRDVSGMRVVEEARDALATPAADMGEAIAGEPADHTGAHVEHCCVRHGCKYGDVDCPVATGKLVQSYPCEDCGKYRDVDCPPTTRGERDGEYIGYEGGIEDMTPPTRWRTQG